MADRVFCPRPCLQAALPAGQGNADNGAGLVYAISNKLLNYFTLLSVSTKGTNVAANLRFSLNFVLTFGRASN